MILRISILLLALIVLPPYYIDKHFQIKGVKRIILWSIVALLIALTALFSVKENFSDAEVYWKGLYLFVLLSIGISETFFCLFSFLGKFFRKTLRKTFDIIGLVSAIATLGLLGYGFFFGADKLKKTNYVYASPKVPEAFNEYRILQISDLHLGTFANHSKTIVKLVDSVNAQKPDLIVFTGDLVNYRSSELVEFMPILSKLSAKDGVYSVLGNHDYAQYVHWNSSKEQWADVYQLISLEKAMGWKVLLNEHDVLRRGNDSLAIVGVENDGLPPFPSRGDLSKALKGLSDACFKVLLSHDPTHWKRKVLPNTNIDLTLSGHTHGMQFKIGSFSPASWFYPEWGGAYSQNNRVLFVSLGFGEVLFPFRLGAWPEINLITLTKK